MLNNSWQDDESSKHLDNTWALDIKGEHIKIDNALSGRKGYSCCGCKKPMEAVKTKIIGRASFFRHAVSPIPGERQCYHTDETFRHKIAKEFLIRTKRVKVPPVYKFPPPNSGTDLKYLLEDSKFIEASKILVEKYFYENEEGEIKIESKDESENRFLLVKPDIIFLDENDKPILLIEIVATHKANEEKLRKLKRLGIDAIEVTLPNNSIEAIGETLESTSRTKWIFNNLEQNTEYGTTATNIGERILPSDEIQKQLFEESYACRSAQVGDLIRSIKRYLASKQYRTTEDGLRQELLRVKGNTDRNRDEWQRLQDKIGEGIKEQFRLEEKEIGGEEEEIARQEREYEQNASDLEGRYYRKRRDIEAGIIEQRSVGGNSEEAVDNRRRIINNEQGEIEMEQIETERTIRNIGNDTEYLPTKYKNTERSIRERWVNNNKREGEEIARIESEQSKLPEEFGRDRREIEERYAEMRRRFLDADENEKIEGNKQFAKKFNDCIRNLALLNNLSDAYEHNKRIKQAASYFDETYFESEG